jgi:hypothetical protein
MGHESVTITEHYSHLYPSVQRQMADRLNEAYKEKKDDNDDTRGKEAEA